MSLSSQGLGRYRQLSQNNKTIHRVAEKNCPFLFLLELRQISASFSEMRCRTEKKEIEYEKQRVKVSIIPIHTKGPNLKTS